MCGAAGMCRIAHPLLFGACLAPECRGRDAIVSESQGLFWQQREILEEHESPLIRAFKSLQVRSSLTWHASDVSYALKPAPVPGSTGNEDGDRTNLSA